MRLSILGLGAAEIGFDNASEATVDALLGLGIDLGINVIDTAECYIDSEEKLGRALRGRRQQYFLFTKCGHGERRGPAGIFTRASRRLWRDTTRMLGRHLADWSPALLQHSIDQSLKKLKTDWLDLIQLHSCSEELLRRGELIEVLKRARSEGKARYIGYSGDGPAARYAAECGEFDSLQMSLNIADQEALDSVVPLARQRGMGIIAKRPIANAVWRNASRPANSYHHVYWDRLQTLRYDFLTGQSAMDIALRFTLSIDGVCTCIVGTTNPAHLRENIERTVESTLGPEQFESIRKRWREFASADWVPQE